MEIPVYLFTGFLDSGKTSFIQETLEDVNFNNGEKILLVVCEEGEVEYNEALFPGNNVVIDVIEDKEQLTKAHLTEVSKKSGAQRVLIEYNGMWMLDELYAALPDEWLVYQEMMFADANSFESYNANMRSLVGDKLKSCEMCVFNRAKNGFDKMAIHKIVRSVSRRAQIAYEYTDGVVEYDDIEDPLPFDINADVIEVKDDDYAVWYRDLVEDYEKYDGKTVIFKGIVARDDRLDANSFVLGRHVMVCCADDISYKGLISIEGKKTSLKTKDWIKVTGKISVRPHKLYKTNGPILDIISYEFSSAPEKEVATF